RAHGLGLCDVDGDEPAATVRLRRGRLLQPPLPVTQPPHRVPRSPAEFGPAPTLLLAPCEPARHLLRVRSRHARHPAAPETAPGEWASAYGYKQPTHALPPRGPRRRRARR